MYPVIHIIQENKGVTIYKDNIVNNNVYGAFDKISKVFKFKSDDLIIVISGYVKQINGLNVLVEYCKKLKFNKVYFFIEDVVRVRLNNIDRSLSINIINQYPDQTFAQEIDTIKYVIKNLKIEMYQIYHCEDNTEILSKNHNIDIKYYDLFSATSCYELNNRIKSISTSNKKIKYKISCFNRRFEWHRYLISCMLSKKPDVFLTLYYKKSSNEIIKNNVINFLEFSKDIQTTILKNNNMFDKNTFIWNNLEEKIDKDRFEIPNMNEYFTIQKSAESFVTLVTETRFASPMPNFSEKTIKPIAINKPFVLLAPPGTLKLLKELGFKTFDGFWDESYDDELDHAKRIEKVYNVCEYILSLDYKKIQKLEKLMNGILMHNYRNLKNVPRNMLTYSLSKHL